MPDGGSSSGQHGVLGILQAFRPYWVSIAASGLFLAVLLLAVQHIRLRSEAGGCGFYRERLEQTVHFNIGLVGLVGRPLSESLVHALSPRSEEPRTPNGRILIVYNSMVCQQCLKDGLSTLTLFRTRLKERGLGVMAVIGSTGEGTMQYTLGLRQAGLLPFPFRYVETGKLEDEFPFQVDGSYIETPLFFHVGEDQRIRIAFKPDRWRMQDLEAWLEAVLAGFAKQELALLRPSEAAPRTGVPGSRFRVPGLGIRILGSGAWVWNPEPGTRNRQPPLRRPNLTQNSSSRHP